MTFGRSPRAGGVHSSSYKAFPQLDRKSVEDVIGQFSSGITYWKATTCPCHDERSGQPALDCTNCRGLGWLHTSAETGQEYQRAMAHSRRSNEKGEKGGRVITGYASITLLPGVVPGDGDLIQICEDIEVVNNEYHIVGSKLRDGSPAETLRFRDICTIEKVLLWEETTTRKVVELPASEWSFNSTERMVVLNGARDGIKYSVRYQAIPEYVVLADTAKPLLRVSHDDGLPDPARTSRDIVFPFNVQAVRLDRAIAQRQRGSLDYTTDSTFNNEKGRGPWK